MSLQANYDAASVAGDTVAYKQAFMALISTALAIQSESVSTANHAARSALALKVLANPVGYTQLMLWGFTVDDTTLTSDQNYKDRASSIWNAYAVQG